MVLVVSISIFFVTIILFVITRCLFYFQVATQVAVLISKIARMELREWPELLPTLLKVCLYMYACRQSKPNTLLIVKANLQSSIFLYKLVFLQIVQNNDSVKAEYLFK